VETGLEREPRSILEALTWPPAKSAPRLQDA
jgi:hypothetical protein